MSAKVFWSICALLASTSLTLAQPATGGQVSVPLSVDGLDDVARQAEAENCMSRLCQAEVTLDRAVNLQIDGASATNGRPRPLPRDRDVRVAAAYQRLVRRSLPMAPDLCRHTAFLMSRFGTPGAPSEVIVPVAAIDLAARLDAVRPGLRCVRTIVAAMPATLDARNAVRAAKALCEAGGEPQRCVAMVTDRRIR